MTWRCCSLSAATRSIAPANAASSCGPAGIADQVGAVADVRDDAGPPAGHRLADRVRKALAERGTDDEVECADELRHVGALAEQHNAILQAELHDPVPQGFVARVAAATDQHVCAVIAAPRNLGDRTQEQFVAFERIEAGNDADRDTCPELQLAAQARTQLRPRPEPLDVEAVRNDDDALLRVAELDVLTGSDVRIEDDRGSARRQQRIDPAYQPQHPLLRPWRVQRTAHRSDQHGPVPPALPSGEPLRHDVGVVHPRVDDIGLPGLERAAC